MSFHKKYEIIKTFLKNIENAKQNYYNQISVVNIRISNLGPNWNLFNVAFL